MGVRVNCKTIDDGFTELPATLWAFVDIILNRILELVGWYCNFVYTITLVVVLQSFIDEVRDDILDENETATKNIFLL
jgi:hypothetical protein